MSAAAPKYVPGNRRSWYFGHVLATLDLFLIVYLFSMNIYFISARDLPEPPLAVRVIGSASVIAALWLWIWMLTDYFRVRPPRATVLWGWLLWLGSFMSALAYFFIVWRQRHRPNDT